MEWVASRIRKEEMSLGRVKEGVRRGEEGERGGGEGMEGGEEQEKEGRSTREVNEWYMWLKSQLREILTDTYLTQTHCSDVHPHLSLTVPSCVLMRQSTSGHTSWDSSTSCSLPSMTTSSSSLKIELTLETT